MLLAATAAAGAALAAPLPPTPTPTPLPADAWAQAYRNWTYYPDWIIPPSCVDPATCRPPYVNVTKPGLADIFQVWSLGDPFASPPPSPRYVGVYTFFDGVGYQTAVATSDDMVHFSQPVGDAGIIFSPRRTWNATPGEFDYGGAAFVGPLLTDYNVTAPRVLARAPDGRFWYAYYAQPTRGSYEPAPGATGLASSADGLRWARETPIPILDADPSHGAQPWEANTIYAPYLVLNASSGEVRDYYNARHNPASDWHEQSGLAWLPGGAAALPGLDLARNASTWVRSPANPVLPDGPPGAFDFNVASDPKVYWDASLGDAGAWVMLYFTVGPLGGKTAIAIAAAFSTDGVAWTKASQPLYVNGGHPRGLDRCDAHKAWLNVDATGRKYLFYTADSCEGRGIALLTSTPL